MLADDLRRCRPRRGPRSTTSSGIMPELRHGDAGAALVPRRRARNATHARVRLEHLAHALAKRAGSLAMDDAQHAQVGAHRRVDRRASPTLHFVDAQAAQIDLAWRVRLRGGRREAAPRLRGPARPRRRSVPSGTVSSIEPTATMASPPRSSTTRPALPPSVATATRRPAATGSPCAGRRRLVRAPPSRRSSASSDSSAAAPARPPAALPAGARARPRLVDRVAPAALQLAERPLDCRAARRAGSAAPPAAPRARASRSRSRTACSRSRDPGQPRRRVFDRPSAMLRVRARSSSVSRASSSLQQRRARRARSAARAASARRTTSSGMRQPPGDAQPVRAPGHALHQPVGRRQRHGVELQRRVDDPRDFRRRVP